MSEEKKEDVFVNKIKTILIDLNKTLIEKSRFRLDLLRKIKTMAEEHITLLETHTLIAPNREILELLTTLLTNEEEEIP